jgi:hypothetical protein
MKYYFFTVKKGIPRPFGDMPLAVLASSQELALAKAEALFPGSVTVATEGEAKKYAALTCEIALAGESDATNP